MPMLVLVTLTSVVGSHNNGPVCGNSSVLLYLGGVTQEHFRWETNPFETEKAGMCFPVSFLAMPEKDPSLIPYTE